MQTQVLNDNLLDARLL